METTEDVLEMVAERMRAMGDPMRLRLLSVLRERDATVGQLVERLGGSQQNISHHLSVLYHDGILARRRDGRNVWYSLQDETVSAVCDAVCDSVTERALGRNNVIKADFR